MHFVSLNIFIIFFLGSVAETNRAPFDLAEAESELVSGFMTEHSAVIFVFFFLAEYASIALICILNSILFLGGYLFDFNYFIYPYIYILQFFAFDSWLTLTNNGYNYEIINFDNYHPLVENLAHGFVIGFKSSIMVFVFIWVRASFPRIRFDQLMSFCWTVLLPVVIAFIILIPCVLYSFDIVPSNISLL